MSGANSLTPFLAGSSLIHALDARVKVPLTLAFILTVSFLPFGVWPVYVLLLALTVSAALLSEIGLARFLRRSLLALPFALAALPLLFTIPGEALARFSLFGLTLTLSGPGLVRFASIAVKSWLSVQAAVLMAATTDLPEMLLALRALKLPRLLAAVIGLMWRYLFVLVDEAGRLLRAREARSGSREGAPRGGGLAWRARVAGGMAGSLLLRSLERSDRVYTAMLARGYDGEVRSLPHPPLSARAWGILAAGLLLLALILFLSRWMVA